MPKPVHKPVYRPTRKKRRSVASKILSFLVVVAVLLSAVPLLLKWLTTGRMGGACIYLLALVLRD